MIASLYQSGSVALAIFFTQWAPSCLDASSRLPFTAGCGPLMNDRLPHPSSAWVGDNELRIVFNNDCLPDRSSATEPRNPQSAHSQLRLSSRAKPRDPQFVLLKTPHAPNPSTGSTQ